MRKSMYALAIFALAIGCAPILPMQKAKLPTQTQTPTVALAISRRALEPTPTSVTVQVIADSLHVRTEPMGLRIGYLYHADTVTLTGSCRSGWAQIVWHAASGSGTAWVNARFLSKNICQTNKE
jgi:hypothetical protein